MCKSAKAFPVFLVSLFLLAACASATPTAEPTPTLGPGQVSVSGALNSTYTISSVDINLFTGENLISLDLESEINQDYSGLHIWVYDGINPGKHPIVNSLNGAAGVSASFFYDGEEGDYTFWSTDGSIDLSSTGGSFTFNAADEDDPSQTITVAGNYEMGMSQETATAEATIGYPTVEETATETVTRQPTTGSIVVTGNLELSYTPGYMSVYTDFDDHIKLFIEPPDNGVATGAALHIPTNLEPGTYDIGNFVTNEGSIFASFYYYDEDGDGRFYSSTQGQLKLTETGAAFSGSFEFKAILHMGEGMADESNNISVKGEFEGIVIEESG